MVFIHVIVITIFMCAITWLVVVSSHYLDFPWHAVADTFHGCGHGQDCTRCLAFAALEIVGIGPDYPLDIPEESWLHSLEQLDDEQVFATGTVVMVNLKFIADLRDGNGVKPIHIHLSAPAGCGKTLVMNVIG